MPPSRTSILALAAVLGACGPDRGALGWIDARSAVVHCTSAGRDRMPPIMLDLPVPEPPGGLYSRGLDPMALDAMGFERDTVACAMLIVPRVAAIDTTRQGMDALVAARAEATAAATVAAGRCTCEVAGNLGWRDLLTACANRSTQTGCDPQDKSAEVAAAIEPLVATIEQTALPLLHWRLVGRTDRPGWFAERKQHLVGAYAGGSTVFVPGQAVPLRQNGALVRALLDEKGVTAVVRQDGGRALLVVRELGKELVLDHFSYAAAGGRSVALLPFLDAGRIDEYVTRMRRPEATRQLVLDPTKGNLVEVDRSMLEDADLLVMAAGPLAGVRYDADKETWTQPEVLVEYAALQAPFGKQGSVLRGQLRLSSVGQQWAQELSDDVLSPTLDELGLEAQRPSFTPASGRLPFLLRGTEVNGVLFHGLHRVPELMGRVENEHPSTVRGKVSAWRFDMPASKLASFVAPDAPAAGLRSAFELTPYVIETSLDKPREVMSFEARPR